MNPSGPLDWTGERWVPGVWGPIAVEHLHRYALAARLVNGATVLDVACGEGYGSAWLARMAQRVVGVDVQPAVVQRARQRYDAQGLNFVCADGRALPFPSACFDWVVCFETLEHMADPQRLLAELARVLRPNGRLLLSTPDRASYAAASGQVNPFHHRELSEDELRALLTPHFPQVDVYWQFTGVFSGLSPASLPTPQTWAALALDAQAPTQVRAMPQPTAPYRVVLAAQHPQPSWAPSVFMAGHEPQALADGQTSPSRRFWYRWGDVLDFTRGGNALIYQVSGWDEASEGGTWTLGHAARVRLDVCTPLAHGARAVLTLVAQGLVGPGHPHTQCCWRINGVPRHQGALGYQNTLELDVTDGLSGAQPSLCLDLCVENPISPQQLSQSDDARLLGVLLVRAVLSQVAQGSVAAPPP
ncbi:MAG: hypothetical protein OHK0048_16390 [Rhodoferax sp.]